MKRTFIFDIAAIVILAGVFVGGYTYYLRTSAPVIDTVYQQSLERRLQAMLYDWRFSGEVFPMFEARDAVSNESYPLDFERPTVILAMNTSGCSPCQVRELRNLDTLYQRLDRDFKFLAVYSNDKHVDLEMDRMEALQLRKVGHASYPVLYTTDPRFADFMKRGRFPMIFVVQDGTVVTSFAPITEDADFSTAFMRALRHTLGVALPVPKMPDVSTQSMQGQVDKDWTVQALNGDKVRFGDLMKNAMLVNFWATWCSPCIEELPTLQAFHEATYGQEIALVLLTDEHPETVRTFMAERGYTLPTFILHNPPPEALHVQQIPTTFMLDRNV